MIVPMGSGAQASLPPLQWRMPQIERTPEQREESRRRMEQEHAEHQAQWLAAPERRTFSIAWWTENDSLLGPRWLYLSMAAAVVYGGYRLVRYVVKSK
jgi:hypothetical protein